MRTYLSSGMTGIAIDVYERQFADEQARQEALGHAVINPATLNTVMTNRTYSDCLRHDLAILLVACDRVVMLPGWQRSKGARCEHDVAQCIGLVVEYSEGAEVPSPFGTKSHWLRSPGMGAAA